MIPSTVSGSISLNSLWKAQVEATVMTGSFAVSQSLMTQKKCSDNIVFKKLKKLIKYAHYQHKKVVFEVLNIG
jgi:hypothetical protein